MSKQICFELSFKTSKLLDCFMVFGKEFHNIGPTTENDIEANVCLLVCGTTKNL